MPFYKCYGCMKTFYSEGRSTACKFCYKILNESINRAPNPPRLKRRHSSPDLGALTQEQQVRLVENRRHPPRFKPRCPIWMCQSDHVTCLGKDESGMSKNGKLFACMGCSALFIWDPDIQLDVRFTYMDVADRMKPLNIVGFRCLGLETGLLAVKKIMKDGFKLRGTDNLGYRTTVHAPIVTSFEGGAQSFPKSGDILPDSGHCFAKTLPGCTTFPNDTTKTDTYIFVCRLRYGFDTHAQQKRDVRSILSYYPGLKEHEQTIGWPLQAFEVAVDAVEPGDMFACIPCKKLWRSKKWEEGGVFVLDLKNIVYREDLPFQVRLWIYRHCEKFIKGAIPETRL